MHDQFFNGSLCVAVILAANAGANNNTKEPKAINPPRDRSYSMSIFCIELPVAYPTPNSKHNISNIHSTPVWSCALNVGASSQRAVNHAMSRINTEPVSTPIWCDFRSPSAGANQMRRIVPLMDSATTIISHTATARDPFMLSRRQWVGLASATFPRHVQSRPPGVSVLQRLQASWRNVGISLTLVPAVEETYRGCLMPQNDQCVLHIFYFHCLL